ncbi:uncharacterized protein LOC110893472 [Helianthus annuus]|uniref:uncharacterized protein LOC110893472 n=1 Tax=Helianthus annuus TaxID=4232 RepID=UPI000B8F384D|nr:uncharacterized protein LOC110893472 [Helianthus annuus]
MIRNIPIILKEWSPSIAVEKEDITTVPVWVKMHDVPLEAFTEDGLSLLASKIGTPKMLDSYMATMCTESWGRSSFARALIDVHATMELKKSITMAIPSLDGKGFTKAEIKVEYDWVPLRCHTCCVFGHDGNSCPKIPKPVEAVGKSRRLCRPVIKQKPKTDGKVLNENPVLTSNPFDVLSDDAELERQKVSSKAETSGVEKQNAIKRKQNQNKSSSREEVIVDTVGVDDLINDIPKFVENKKGNQGSKGASTPGKDGVHG